MDVTPGESKPIAGFERYKIRPYASRGVHKNERARDAISLAISAVSHVPEPSALSQFRWESPECGLFRRPKDDPQIGDGKSSAEWGTVSPLISSIARAAWIYGTRPRDWVARPPKTPRKGAPALPPFANRAIRGCDVTAFAIAFLRN